ncbi:PREDICTED: uncharacterized protein LOC107350588 [Acropora digitifera]|uniref:uncharacterized protein LOC107350588 n=1 Tax=Acropora digitifera TaxID=70779 RepID=UPI00077A080D|nr:PREDICTED: uncharacterized protein LOC107350588 [Acropora digitifera]
MFSKKSILENSALLFLENVLDESDLLCVYDVLNRKNPRLPYWNYRHFDLNTISQDECKTEFRFGKTEILVLAEALQIPHCFTCVNGTVASGIEGLCMLLKRFTYPCRLSDMIPRFGRSVPELSLILSEVCNYVYNTHGHLLSDLNQPWLQPNQLQAFADAIHQKGAALNNCWGFIDGTVRPLCRPGENQRVLYNGHKRVDGIKFQSVVAPNGMIANLYGPVEGKRHDAGMLTNAQKAFNPSMSSVRIAVEWVFGDIVNYFGFLDFKKNLKIGLSPVGKIYCVCALLRNALTCLYGSSTSSFFELQPPSIHDYFQV